MAEIQTGLKKAGDVQFDELKLINSTNEVIDLSEFLVEINIFEDIINNYM